MPLDHAIRFLGGPSPPRCLSPSLSARRLMHHARQRPPSFVRPPLVSIRVCVCVCVVPAAGVIQHRRALPIALSRGILNAGHNRPIACHRDSLAERKKKRARVRFSEAPNKVGRRSILGGNFHQRLWSSSRQSFSLELVLFCHLKIKKCQARIMEPLCRYVSVHFAFALSLPPPPPC